MIKYYRWNARKELYCEQCYDQMYMTKIYDKNDNNNNNNDF